MVGTEPDSVTGTAPDSVIGTATTTNDATILSAIVHIQKSLDEIKLRQISLETEVTGLKMQAYQPGPVTQLTTPNPDVNLLTNLPGVSLPSTSDQQVAYTLKSALRSTSTLQPAYNNQSSLQGMSLNPNRPSLASIANVELIPEPVRVAIISGKDVNLGVLLLSMDYLEARGYQSGKADKAEKFYYKLLSDPMANRLLSIAEFVKAFGIYKKIISDTFPERQQELDSYERDIIEMSVMFSGAHFYDYHRRFSAKAAAVLAQMNIVADWSQRDNNIFIEVFSGLKANRCKHCTSINHNSESCASTLRRKNNDFNPQTDNFNSQNVGAAASHNTSQSQDRSPRPRHEGREICMKFNYRNCSYGLGTRLIEPDDRTLTSAL